MWPEIVEIRLRKGMGLLQCHMGSKIEITLKQIGILHQGTGVVGRPGENRRDWRSDDKTVSGLCMSISPTSSYDGCIEEGKRNLANGNSVSVITSSCTIESLEGERQLDLKLGYVGNQEVKVPWYFKF